MNAQDASVAGFFGVLVTALEDELAEEVETDARRKDSAGGDDAGERVEAIGIPEAVRDDWAGEVGDGWSEGEEAVAVGVVACGDLGEQGVFDLVLDVAAVAGDVAEVFMEEFLHAVADVAVDGRDGDRGAVALAEAGEVCAPAGWLAADLRVERADGGVGEGGLAVGVVEVALEEFALGGRMVRPAVDHDDAWRGRDAEVAGLELGRWCVG